MPEGIIPKWIINFVAPRKPGEWIDCLKRVTWMGEDGRVKKSEGWKGRLSRLSHQDLILGDGFRLDIEYFTWDDRIQ